MESRINDQHFAGLESVKMDGVETFVQPTTVRGVASRLLWRGMRDCVCGGGSALLGYSPLVKRRRMPPGSASAGGRVTGGAGRNDVAQIAGRLEGHYLMERVHDVLGHALAEVPLVLHG